MTRVRRIASTSEAGSFGSTRRLLSLALALVALSPCLATAMDSRLHSVSRLDVAPPSATTSFAQVAFLTDPEQALDGWQAEDAVRWTDATEGERLGRIVIPRIGLDADLVKGVAEKDLRNGPGWMTTSDMPARSGNCVICGHRTTYLAPFRHIDELRQGDEVFVETPNALYAYAVADSLVVDASEAWVTASTPSPQLTLTACHPPGSARQRLVVSASLSDIQSRPADYGP